MHELFVSDSEPISPNSSELGSSHFEMETRERNSTYSQKTEWLLVKNGEKEERIEEDVHAAPSYSAYPTPERFPDKLPPDYPAILSLLFSVISICWNVFLSSNDSTVECFLFLAFRCIYLWFLCWNQIQRNRLHTNFCVLLVSILTLFHL